MPSPTHPPTDTGAIGAERSVLEGLLARVEAASECDVQLLIEVAVKALPIAYPSGWLLDADLATWRFTRFDKFVGAGAWTEAALALCDRVLPDCVLGVRQRFVPDWVAETYQRETGRQTHAVAQTPALALLAAMLRALLAQASIPATTPTGVLETSLIVEAPSNDASET